MVEEVPAFPALAGPRSRRDGEVAEQSANLLAHFFAVHDHVDQTVFLKKLGGLKSFRQILMRSFFDYAGPGEADHALRFSDNDRSEERRVGKECRSRWSP